MDLSLEELLFQFLLYTYPELLQDEEAFEQLLRLTHALMRRAAKAERERLMKVSSC